MNSTEYKNIQKKTLQRIEIDIDSEFTIKGITRINNSSSEQIGIDLGIKCLKIFGNDLTVKEISINDSFLSGKGVIKRLELQKKTQFKNFWTKLFNFKD